MSFLKLHDNSSSSSDDFSATGSYSSFATVLILNITIAVGIFVAFGILRSFRVNKYFFAPQYYEQDGTTDSLPDPGIGLFSWISPVIKFKEEELLLMRGLDTVMYLKFLKYMIVLFLLFAPIGLGVILPLDAVGTELEERNGIPSLSLANVPASSNKLYIHALYTVFCSIITFVVLYRLYIRYTHLRIKWMKMDVAHNYTVMYKGIPKETLKHTSPIDLFSQYFPGEVVDAQVGVNTHGLRKLVKKWDKFEEKLRFARASLAENGKRVTTRTKPLIGKKVDAIEFYYQKLVDLGAEIEAKRAELTAKSELSSVGFVTFRTMSFAYRNSQTLMDGDSTKLQPTPAPEPTDVDWKELELPSLYRPLARPFSWLIVAALVFFWGTLTVFVQTLANLEGLAKIKGFGWLESVLNWNPALTGLISGFLPALLLIILFALLPKFIATIVRLRGVYTRSQVQRNVLKVYFWFLVVNVFAVSLLSGTTLSILHQFVNGTGSEALSILGEALPAQSSFFINYILTYALFTYPMNILRVGPFVISKLKKRAAKCEAECKKAQQPGIFQYEISCAIQVLIFTIGFCYAPIASFILPWTIIFFSISYLFGKYLLIYVYNPEYDSGGLFWPIVFNRVIGGMLLGQVILIGVFIFKTHPAVAIVAPLPLFTLGFAYVMHNLFDRPSTYLALNEYPLLGNNGEIFHHLYRDPLLSLDTHASVAGRKEFDMQKEDLEAGGALHSRPMVGYGSI